MTAHNRGPVLLYLPTHILLSRILSRPG